MNNILFFLLSIFILFLLVVFSSIQIKIDNLNGYIDSNKKEIDFKIFLIFKLLGFIKLFKIKIKKNSIKNKNLFNIKKLIKTNTRKKDISNKIKSIKRLDINVEKINLNLDIGIEDAAITAISIGILSSIISTLFERYLNITTYKKWRIQPIYGEENILKFDINCIINLKLLHIIYTVLKKDK